MALYKRYSGEFASRDGGLWRCEIWQEASAAFSVGELRFGVTPLVIEWPEVSKEDVIRSSSATLTIESPGDRTYADLYTIAVGAVRLDVYKDNALWWSGCLDPEFYEEPFTRNFAYDVQLTFSDFGILKRRSFDLTGQPSVHGVVTEAVARSGIKTGTLVASCVSTRMSSTGPLVTAETGGLHVFADNFFDEEGEPSSWWDALEGVLHPLGVHITQRSGRVRLFDLNGLASQASSARTQVEWDAEDQRLGTDKVASRIRVTLSVYCAEDKQRDITYEDGTTTDINASESHIGPQAYDYYTIHRSLDATSTDYAFNICASEAGSGIAQKNTLARYFKFVRLYGGEEAEGLAYSYVVGKTHYDGTGTRRKCVSVIPAPSLGALVLKTHPFAVSGLPAADQSKFRMRLRLEVLFDPRFNPFEGEEGNEKDAYDLAKYEACEVAVPVAVELTASDGSKYHWTNTAATSASITTPRTMGNTVGEWVAGAAPVSPSVPDAYLRYYDQDIRSKAGQGGEGLGKGGMLGWRTNRQALGGAPSFVAAEITRAEDGQYLPYPPASGEITVIVYGGMSIIHYLRVSETTVGEQESPNAAAVRSSLRWVIYKAPKLEILNNDTIMSKPSTDDIVYTGELAEGAAEEMDIDTVCGTAGGPVPGALGLYLDSSGAQVQTLCRASRTAGAEDLLIGTLYSQFAARHDRLTGTMRTRPEGDKVYTERCMSGKILMLTGCSCDIAACENTATLVELSADEATPASE